MQEFIIQLHFLADVQPSPPPTDPWGAVGSAAVWQALKDAGWIREGDGLTELKIVQELHDGTEYDIPFPDDGSDLEIEVTPTNAPDVPGGTTMHKRIDDWTWPS